MKTSGKIKKMITVALFAIAFLVAASTAKTCSAAQITDDDFIKANGKVLRNSYGMGSRIILRGVNAGGWLVQEPWMCPTTSTTKAFDQKSIESTLKSRFGDTKAQELLDVYMDNYWTEEDFDNCEQLGMNLIRLPFWYMNIVDESGNEKSDAFSRIDWFVEEARERGIYVILDMHGAPGSQNGEVHSGDSASGIGLLSGVDVVYNQQLYLKVWEMVAKHYNGNPAVAGYDLLNEPYCSDGQYTNSQVWDLYDRAYDTIRGVDKDHLIIMEATWEPYNLPDPSTYGWSNVMYEYHSYNYDDTSSAAAQLSSIQRKINLISQTGYNVPSYIGETSFFDNTDSWEQCLSALNTSGLSWSIWTYKVTGDGTNSWGLYNMSISSANLERDSYDTISSKWAASKTDTSLINSQIVQVLDKFISFTPSQIKIGDAVISSIADQIYTGKALKPALTVKHGDVLLTEGKDYTVTYSNNVQCGNATATVTGIGDYDGVVEVNFKIVPEATSKFSAKKQTTKSISLSWKKNYNADGYYIYMYKGGRYKKIATLKSYCTSYKVKKLKPGKKYRFRIVAYKNIDSKACNGAESSLTWYTKPKATKLKAKRMAKGTKLSWKKIKTASGYQICISKARKGKYKKLKTLKSAKKKTLTVKNAGSSSYYKVRAYIKVGKNKIYGKYSKAVKAKF